MADLTIGQKIDAIIKWQTDGEMHPLTCRCKGGKSFEEIIYSLSLDKLSIVCPICATNQDWIPEVIFQKYIKEVK